MRINKQDHKKLMLKILMDISADPILSINLGFKGGTCCYFFYDLDRFSVDLDFDLLDLTKQDEILKRLDIILTKYGQIKMIGSIFSRKVKYNDNFSSIKVDISDRKKENSINTYEVKDILSGVPLKVLQKEDIFAHKLIALTERYNLKEKNKTIANRDLYDIYFFFENNWKFNSKIIELRSGKKALEYLKELNKFVETKVDNQKILNGLGSLVDDKKRLWVKNSLKSEVLKQISLQMQVLKD